MHTYGLLAALLLLGRGAWAESPPYDTSKCNTCHAPLLAKKQVHSLFPGSSCDTCHEPTDKPEKPAKCQGVVSKGWKLTQPEPKLCLDCHEQNGPGTPHSIITSTGCTSCHDAHSSDNPNQLVAWPAPALCGSCHDAKDQAKSVHTPVKKGDCLGCHDPHRGESQALLKAPAEKLCATCHKPEKLSPAAFTHAPVVEGRCGGCHDAHGSDHPRQTLAEGKAQCLACHDKKVAAGADKPGPAMRIDLERKSVHPAVESGDCQDCHVAGHSSAVPALLQKPAVELCLGCHDRKDTGFIHGAVRAGDCTGCHEPHSAPEPALLRAADAKLCFRCHDDDVTGRASVHKPVADGKCADCHEPHAAPNPFSLKTGAGVKACSGCHADVVKGKNVHAPITRNGCTACHDPHGGNGPSLLVKDTNALCQSCHTAITSGMHVTSMVPRGHKMAGGPDPHDVKKDFSCASCHDPHASSSPKLLRSGESTMESCDFCHGDRSGKHPELKDIHHAKRPPKPVASKESAK